MHQGVKYNCILETGTSCELSFGTQVMSLWMNEASLEKTWATSTLKGILNVPSLTLILYLYSALVLWSTRRRHIAFVCSLDGCQEWRTTSRKLMSTTDLWMEMEISTGGSSLALTTYLQSSCVLSLERCAKSWMSNKTPIYFLLIM